MTWDGGHQIRQTWLSNLLPSEMNGDVYMFRIFARFPIRTFEWNNC